MQSEVITNFIKRPKFADQTAAYKIFHYKYMCRIASMHLVSMEYLREATVVTTGRPEWDRELSREVVHVQLSIAAMAEYREEGAQIYLIEREDAAKIYRLIREHLNDWLGEVQMSLHKRNPPLDDLRKLDVLAGDLYPYARHYLTERPFHGKLGEQLARLSRARGGATRRLVVDPVTTAPAKPEAAPHHPLVEAIAKADRERKKAWS